MDDVKLTELARDSGGLTVTASFAPHSYERWTVTLTPATGKPLGAFGDTLSEAIDHALDPAWTEGPDG
jgi:hypothetical protein